MQKLTRRNVIVTLTSSTVMLCPAILNAQDVSFDWGEDVPTTMPRGEDQLIQLSDGEESVDITDLEPGQVAVIARPTDDDNYSNTGMTQYIAVLHRTEAQMAQGDTPGAAQDARYLVANLVCPHRGHAIGMTGLEEAPFACTKRGSRHDSLFNAAGMGIDGASDGDPMSIPAYSLTVGDSVVLTLM